MEKYPEERKYIGVRYYYGSSHSGREWSLSKNMAYELARADAKSHHVLRIKSGSDWDGSYYYAYGYPRYNR